VVCVASCRRRSCATFFMAAATSFCCPRERALAPGDVPAHGNIGTVGASVREGIGPHLVPGMTPAHPAAVWSWLQPRM